MKLIGDVPADRQTTPRVDQVDQAVRLVDVRQHSELMTKVGYLIPHQRLNPSDPRSSP